MAFGPDSDGRTRTYRVYSRQTNGGPYSLGIHTVEATADNIDEQFTALLNVDPSKGWVRWFLLVAVNGNGAFPYRATKGADGWSVTRV